MSTAGSNSEPISAADVERYRDAEWALRNPEVQRQYEGQWVVAYQRQVIAHGADPKTVAVEAAHVAAGHSHRPVFCAPEDPFGIISSKGICR